MTITAILVLVAFLSMAAIIFFAKGRVESATNLATLRTQILPLDLDAFRNLIDWKDEEFLRSSLDSAQFRAVQRIRLLAAIDYIFCASRNAAILHKFGEAARHSPISSVAEAGDKLVNSAIRFRLNALQTVVRLYVAIILHGNTIHRLRIAEAYEHLTTLVVVLGCMQFEKRKASAPVAPRLVA